MLKNVSIIFLVYCFSCCFYGIAMEDNRKEHEDEVKRTWIPKASLALRLMEEAQKAENSVRYHREELTVGSFNGGLDRVSIYIYDDPEKKDERIEVNYKFEEFKKLLAEPLPSPKLDDGPTADHFAPHPEEEKKCCCGWCYFCCCS